MKAPLVVGVAASIVLGVCAFLASDTWYFGLGVGMLSLTMMVFYVVPSFLRFGEKNRKRHECYLFIHSYLVTLSVVVSMQRAYEAASSNLGKEFHHLDATLATMEAKEKVEYLNAYFESDLYRLFLSILNLYLDRGGDVLKLSNELTAESSRVEESEQSYQKKAAQKALGFFFLWLVSVVIVVFMRFGLSSFFSSLRMSPMYLGSLAVFFGFLLISIGLYTYMHTGVGIALPRRKRRVQAKA